MRLESAFIAFCANCLSRSYRDLAAAVALDNLRESNSVHSCL